MDISNYTIPDSLPDEWQSDLETVLTTSGSYKTYFTLSSGSSGDTNFCSAVDLSIWSGLCDGNYPGTGILGSGSHYFNNECTASTSLAQWAVVSGALDISNCYYSGSAGPVANIKVKFS